ncbi:PLP-dependent transferase [Alkalicaulis satelles]|uniref:PLP-dependent transferase n=1 Tax=Alkalicaulis satelles TaxID=2609175 RepID=A0A5M6ZJB9_9PROT|nr:PLP-dependent aspartate aminotransferase family protein [Alkalicaulis satelles]KAA5804903.1 PLP-dependent transferase [Alkalicaulis satelles]
MARRPETLAAQALHRIDVETGAVIPPVHLATTYARDGANALIGAHDYIRPEGPTQAHAAALICALEGGADARLFSSGLAAAAAVFATLPAGAHVVAQTKMYYGAKKLLQSLETKGAIVLAFFDPDDPDALARAVKPGATALIWIETPANPLWSVVDIARAAETARSAGARLAVDSTSAPPCTTRSLDLGADYVVHSATKYLNGHSDVLAGAVVTRAKDEAWQALCDHHSLTGAVPGAFEAWLLIRGLRTLFVRFERQSANALRLAQSLEGHPGIAQVLYPGLPAHPGHAIAARQMTGGYGGLLSLRLRGGAKAAAQLAASTEVFIQATSIGGVESLIEHRKPIEGPQSPTPDDLVRLSCGLEAADDLMADLMTALERV